ncbi:MAG: hypothetical protein IKF98_00685 [Clostridia bacterium]|nr:hypothetical protein [Clostridia bacterium]
MKHLKWMVGLAAVGLLLSKPQAAAQGAAGAMVHWYASVAPALFPFLALMPLLTCGEAVAAYEALLARPMGRCFNLPGAAAPGMMIGLVAGTPAGAMAARDIAGRAGLNRGQLQRLAVASAGFSPAFLVGGIGAGMLNSAGMGWRLAAAQLLAQVSLLMLLRQCWMSRTTPACASAFAIEERPIRGAVLGVLTICGYMTLFGAISTALEAWVGRTPAEVLLCLLDVPSGALRVSGMALPESVKLPLLAGMCGFGGMCAIVQCLDVLKGCGVKAWEYMGVRMLAGLLCAAYMILLQRLPSLENLWLFEPIRNNPLAIGGFIGANLALPMLIRQIKMFLNNVNKQKNPA